jgi:hypothetical protein
VITVNFSKRELKGFFAPHVPCLNIEVNELMIPYVIGKNLLDPIIISDSASARRIHTVLNLKNIFDMFG